MLDGLWCRRGSWIVGEGLERCSVLRFRCFLAFPFSRNALVQRTHDARRFCPRVACLPIVISWVLNRNVLEILYYGAHCLFMGGRRGWYIDNIQLVDFKLLSRRSNKCIRIFNCPEVDVKGMNSKKISPLIARIGIREPPMMFRSPHRRLCPFMVTVMTVDYDGTQGRVFVRLAHNRCFHSCTMKVLSSVFPQKVSPGLTASKSILFWFANVIGYLQSASFAALITIEVKV